MRLLIGLGNPGERYASTRHNVGARAIERAAARWRIPLTPYGQVRRGDGRIGAIPVTLAVPLTWMNTSGLVVPSLLETCGCPPDQLLVVHDDMDLPLGRLRLRQRGGPGGHNGILSIIETLGTEQFGRLKLGIGRPVPGLDPADFVLAPFGSDEQTTVEAMLDQAVLALECATTEGLPAAMNRFNAKEPMADGE